MCSSAAQRNQLQRPDGKIIPAIAIDNIVKQLMDTAEVTGLCLGIINNNEIAYTKAYGYKNKSLATLNDTATCFYGASYSKAVFAYLVMQLVDEGLIDLDKPLYTYLNKPLPEYESFKDLAGDDRWKLITARHCLSHTTGFLNLRQFNPNNNGKLEIFFTPGARYAYSGEGINLLQFVIEAITSRKLEDLAKEKIFGPLGMKRTGYIWENSFESDYAVGHNMNEDTIRKSRRRSSNAAGSLETTIADYTRFVAAVMQGKEISKKAKDEMLSPQIRIYNKRQFPSLNNDTTSENNSIELAYGLGWGLFNTPYGKAFFKEGHGTGWQHYNVNIPDKKISIIVMANSDNAESMFKELLEKTMAITIPWYWESYTPYRSTVKLPQTVLQQFIGEYNGKLNAVITLENGQLKVESKTASLQKSNLYAQNDHHFFMKVMNTEIDFVKGPDGNIEKAVVNDEGGQYELKKIK
jgi:CubicO group peptidase (beta-lactamase class C family)